MWLFAELLVVLTAPIEAESVRCNGLATEAEFPPLVAMVTPALRVLELATELPPVETTLLSP